ncbi:MAG: prepilin-type N-terminal cleavage/methylation domain-containing protein [Candidatus Omnitrophota bacterium]|nr:prepilin-type N-terminal cleavage/methylation domain-containing protein [Candidatus Omnitrophota bacterium]
MELSKGFSLLEVLITVGILASVIVFIFRAFGAALNSARFSQNLLQASYLAENKIWEIKHRAGDLPKDESGKEDYPAGRQFNWRWQKSDLAGQNLSLLNFTVSWKEKAREKDYEIFLLSCLSAP